MSVQRELFVRDGPVWRATLPTRSRSLLIIITAGKKGPDEALISLVERVTSAADRLEKEARGFIEAFAPQYASKVLTLSGLDFRYPASGWKPQGLSIDTREPSFGLQFDIAGDHNVLDVNFVKDRPVEADYH